MKYAYTALAIGGFLLSPTGAIADDLEEFAQRFIEAEASAWQEGDLQKLEELEGPNVIYYTSAGQILTDGFEAHRQYILANRENIAELDQQWEYLAGDGSIFSMTYTSIAQTRTQEIKVDALFVFQLENGRIVRVWTNGTTTVEELE